MSQGENSLRYIILHVLDVSVTYTLHSNSYCKMHTLSSKAKREMLNVSALQDSRLATSLQKTNLYPTRSLWSDAHIADCVVLCAEGYTR